MPAWQVFDETTAHALKDLQVEGPMEVSAPSDGASSLLDGDAVLIAPTHQAGEVFVITARRRPSSTTPSITHQTPEVPISAPEKEIDEQLTFAGEDVAAAEAEQYFGPTTWERMETPDVLPESVPARHTASIVPLQENTVPEPWEIRLPEIEEEQEPTEIEALHREQSEPISSKSAPPQQISNPPVEQSSPTQKPPDVKREYVATGFLGLDDYAEDEEELRRSKLPWWKKLFID